MLRFEEINYLYLFLSMLLILLSNIYFFYWRSKSLKQFGDKQLIKRLQIGQSTFRKNFKNLLRIFCIIFIIIAFANPQIGSEIEEVKRKGIDLMIAIDLSNSMLVEDIKPNRLEKSKRAISELLDQLSGDRIGLVVFGSDAFIQLPITTDYSAAKLFLSSVNTKTISSQGTEIGKAIDKCLSSFDFENSQNKSIIIITDGENHDDFAIESSKKAKEKGVLIHTLGMGLEQGGPIPIKDKRGNNVSYRKDKSGNTIISKLNELMLMEIAQSGGGKYIRANNSRAGLQELINEINRLEKKEIGTMEFTNFKDRFQFFLIIALILLFLDLVILERKNEKFNF